MSFLWVYMTAASADEAAKIGRVLVEDRLAACVNILDGMRSLYWWDGAVQEGAEAVLIAKTRADLLDRLAERVQELHSYSCPCVVALPILGGNAGYLDWIAAETAGAGSPGPRGETPLPDRR